MPHPDPDGPPRRRANKAVGHGPWGTDRPPVCGAAGRSDGRLVLRVGRRSGSDELVHQTVVPVTTTGATVYTDGWSGYKPPKGTGRGHATVDHNAGEWARDDDGGGVREVHCDTSEGLWTGVRNFLRIFRGVNKRYLEHSIKMFEWCHNTKRVNDDSLRVVLGGRAKSGKEAGRRPTTRSGT